jgi:lipid A ethanolaminephosphotransferase
MRDMFVSTVSALVTRLYQPQAIHSRSINIVFAVLLTALYNDSLWLSLHHIVGIKSLSSVYFYLTFFILASTLCFSFLSVAALFPGHKYSLTLIVIGAAMGSYFIDHYGVYIDSEMIVNVLQTDSHETLEMLNSGFALHFLIYAAVPALLIFRLKIIQDHSLKGTITTLAVPAISLITVLALCLPSYQTMASVMRAHKEIRYLVTPSNIIYGLGKALSDSEKIAPTLARLDATASLGETWLGTTDKPLLFVLIVGETARAANFSLDHYARNTNPNLASKDIIYYSEVTACGTSTAISLPCMFSDDDRAHFSRKAAAQKENLLDLIAQVGLDVSWFDNNSGCKGVCVRTPQLKLEYDSETCNSEHCFDLAMLQALAAPADTDQFIVMHQQGSHGPYYSQQVPDDLALFVPTCETSQLQDCSREEIVNAYDNTILYTDLFIAQTIERLEQLSDKYTTAVIYISDHGESLGEKGIYLHAAPYFMAPKEQLEVPMLAWLSEDFSQRFGIDQGCLERAAGTPISHDNLFSSVLGLLDITSKVYNPTLDIFRHCTGR